MPVNTKKCPTPGCGDECPADLDYCPACGTELPAGRAPTAIEQLDAPQAPSSAPSAKPAQRQRDKTIITGHEADDTIELQRLGPELKPQGKPYRFEDRTTFTIGREVADILLQTDTQVSKTHAKVWISGSQCLLDAVEGSTNGVFIRLPKGDQWELQDGDEILMASEFLKFSHPGGSVAHEPTPKSTVSSDDDLIGGNMMDGAAESPGAGMATPPGSGGRAPTEFHLRKSSIRGGLSGMSSASERAGATGSGATPSREDVPGAKSSLNARRSPSKEFKTEVLGISDPRPMAHVSRCHGGKVTASLYLHKQAVTFGREGCTFNFPDGKISRQHAEISSKDGRWFLKDIGSSNGTYIRIRGPMQLLHEDEFRVGSACFKLNAPKFRPDEEG